MVWLILGVLLWSGVHLLPVVARPFRERLISSWGEMGYKGAFAVLILASLALIVVGWRSTPQVALYSPPGWGWPLAFLLMIIAFVLAGASHRPTVIKRFIRHPQLTSIAVWALSHLISNGTTRALVLFGGLGLWALIEIPLISARDGAYPRPEAPGMRSELIGLAVTAVIFIVVLFLHPYFAGVSPLPH